MLRPSLLFGACLQLAAGQVTIKIAGSSTVFPVARAWADGMDNASDFAIAIDGGGSSAGAQRVCHPSSHPEHVDIGDMSREWKSTEALLLDDGYTWECAESKVRVTQLHVGTDGLAVVVGKDSQAHDCLTRSEVGGLTLGMLHWIFTNWTDVQLMEHGLDLASVLPNNDHDGVKEWSDFSPSCAEVPINAYGPGPDSGTYSFFGEATLCEPCFNKDEGSLPEYFMWCPLDDLHAMKDARVNGTLEDYVATMRPPNCYMSSESDVELIEWLTADSGGIAYLGYAYYTSFQNELTIARVASDTKMGIKDTRDVKVMPSTYTIMDGSYSVYTRQLYMNVDNEAWDRVYPFLSYGFSTAGRALVSQVGYVPLNIALLAKMKIRIEERGNQEADYVSVPPATCPIGTELTSLPFINAFGNSKVNYTCTPCTAGMYKFLDTPTSCRACEPGRYAELPGQSRCLHCDPGYEVVNGTSCRACSPGLRKREAAAVACTTCPPGSFNNESAQAECVFCGPGRFAPAGSTRCFDCPLNEFAATPGSGQCTACPEGAVTFASGSTGCSQCRVGFYRKAEAQCEPCPGSTTTAYQGATTQAECVCAEGWYLPLNADIAGNGSCVSCGPGLDCVLGSDLQVYDRFRAGETMVLEDQLFPKLLPGHFATMDEPTKVFRCGDVGHCPGGLPGACAPGRTGLPCGRCQVGHKFLGDRCGQCSDMDVIFLFLGVAIMAAGIPLFYYFMNSPMTSKASTMLSTAVAFGMTLTLLQTIGLVGLVSMRWPSYMKGLMDFVNIFMLDLEAMNFDCVGVSSATRYVVSVLCWPAALVWLGICASTSLFLPARYGFVKGKALSTLGQVFQIGFTIMSKTALMPFMCYRHPNGRASVLRFSDVLCWESSDHTLMVVFGIFMTASMALYWSILVCCTLLAPRLSNQGNVFFLTATRFLFFRFRTDCWWYGTWFIMRGPLLSLPVAIFTDLPQVQLFCMTAVIETYMVIQLVVWPWKTPLINLADGSMNMMMILLLSLGTTFLDALEGDARMTYSRIAVGILGILYFVAFLLLCAALYALCHKVSMGSSEEHWVLTLGRPPSTTKLCEAFEALQIAYRTVDSAVIEKAIDDLSVYDRRMLATVLTTVAPMLGNDRRMKLARRLSVTTTSLASTVRSQGAAETMAERMSSPQPQKVESTEVPPSAHIRREVAQSAYI